MNLFGIDPRARASQPTRGEFPNMAGKGAFREGTNSVSACAAKPRQWGWGVAGIVLGFMLMLFLLSGAVNITLNFRLLYYADIGILAIPSVSGMEEAEIRENYDALIEYNSLFYRGPLEFPSFVMSETGRVHFEEVKAIFDAVQVLMLAAFLPVVLGAVWLLRKKRPQFLKWGGIFSLAIPSIAGLLAVLHWQWFFVRFHELFFDNDYWIFDATTDPVITILPDAFFFHCLLMIAGLVLLFAAGLLVVYFRIRNRKA